MRTIFKLSQKQQERAIKWSGQHYKDVHAINSIKEISGAFLQFSFIPSGYGTSCTAQCIHCVNQKIDLTEDEDGEFIYSEEEMKR